MKKLICFSTFIFAFGLQTISAQVPGYQGKRFFIGYNASSFFYCPNFTFENGLLGIFELTRISYKTEVNVNYALSRKVAAGFSYYTAKQNDAFTNDQIQNYGYMQPTAGIAQCKLAIYEIHFQFFRKNFIAPAGLYNQLSVGIVKYGLATPDNKLTVYSTNLGGSGNPPLILTGPAEKYTCYKLGYAIGKTNPIGHNFYINTALGVNFFRGGDAAYVKTTPSTQNYILANFNKNLRTHNFVEIKIGLGWIAF
ncbi:MAG: hypothetical protein NT084_11610 [Bacteroidetes bacterium]|jgi:hypothetical protein|nr:hypothetical protein [Bacteroidota bacterium]